MKRLISKQSLIFAITLCIITSCKLTGNFAIVKRQHTNGYYIQMPSFVKNSDSKSTPVTKHTKQPETVKIITTTDNDSLIASVNTTPLIETAPQAKTITQAKINYAPQNIIKTITSDIIKRKTSCTSYNTSDNNNYAEFSLAAFVFLCIASILILLALFPFTVNVINGLIGCSIVSAFFGLCYILHGLRGVKIKLKDIKDKNSEDFFLCFSIIMLIAYILILLIVLSI